MLRGTAVASGAAVGGVLFGADAFAAPASTAAVSGSTNPSWLPAGLHNTFDPVLEVYNYKPSNTARHLAGLAAAKAGTGNAVEVFIGDSSTDGYTGAGYERLASWPMVYRNALAQAGVPVGGTGWVRVTDVLSGDPRWVIDSSWVNVYVVVYTGTIGATATYTETLPGTAVSVLFSAAAFASFTVSVDGATSGPGFLHFEASNQVHNDSTVTLTGLPNTAHTVVITATSKFFFTLEAAMVHTPGTGLIAHNMSQSGSKASGTGGYSWSDYVNGSPGKYFASPDRYLQTPSTVWIALGGNDIAVNTDPAAVAKGVKAIAQRFPNSDIFLVLEYQVPGATIPNWTAYAGQLYQLADALDVPLFDQWAKMGSYATYSANGYAGDTKGHLNAKGYAVLGNLAALVAALPVATGDGGGDPGGPNPSPGVNVINASGAAVTLPAPTTFPMNYVQLTADCTLTFPPPTGGQRFDLLLAQLTTPRTVIWPANLVWPGHTTPTLSTAAGARDVFSFVCIDGVKWLGSVEGLGY